MNKYKVLFITNEDKHTINNSVYSIVNYFFDDVRVEHIHVLSKGNKCNNSFFEEMISKEISVFNVKGHISFNPNNNQFNKDNVISSINAYDVIMMRIARPISDDFLMFLKKSCKKNNTIFINDPMGIIKTSTKEFLLNYPKLSKDMFLCKSKNDIIKASKLYPIVLKPLKGYGGSGIVKVFKDKVIDLNNNETSINEYLNLINDELNNFGYLGMKYLKNVTKGDKRIIVVNGKVLAASIRLPKENSWICNVSSGGKSVFSEINKEEYEYVEYLSNILKKEGVIIWGLDTLVGDDGRRVISEVNTLSVGGFPQAQVQTGKPILKTTVNLIFDYLEELKCLKQK